jgi:hypothetical protein
MLEETPIFRILDQRCAILPTSLSQREVHGSATDRTHRAHAAVKRSFTGPRDDGRCMTIALKIDMPDRAETAPSKALCPSARAEILSGCGTVATALVG